MTAAQSIYHPGMAQAGAPTGLGRAASLRQLGVGGLLIVAYSAATRIGHLEAAKIGIQIGPVPLFLTEMFMIAAGLIVVITRPNQIVCWLTTGGMARLPGLLLWLLFLTSIVQALLAFNEWGILALRDMAIFSYGIVFALAYFILDTREKAAAVMRWFTYSGVVLAAALIADTVSGAHKLFLYEARFVTAQRLFIESFGGGDVGGIISFALIALLAYAVSTAERRLLHIACAAVSLYALTITQTRSAALGLFLGMVYSLFGMRTTQRISFVAVIAGAVLTFIALPVLLPDSGLSHAISTFSAAVSGGLQLRADDNFYFRLLRWDRVFEVWRENPIFGAGFGRPLIPRGLIDPIEEPGMFNAGLPHNTYLTVLARLGVVGFVLIMGAWIGGIVLATKGISRERFGADAFAAGATLVAMMGYATFVLFLERPMHAASLWIVAAIACRLATPDVAPQMMPRPAPRPRTPVNTPVMDGAIRHARRIARVKGFG